MVMLDKYYGKDSKAKEERDREAIDLEEEIKKVNEKIAVEITEVEEEEEVVDIDVLENAPIVKMVNIIFKKLLPAEPVTYIWSLRKIVFL